MPVEREPERVNRSAAFHALPGLIRTARRGWRCACADPVLRYAIRATFGRGRRTASAHYRTYADAKRGEELMRERPPDLRSGVPYESVEIVPHCNPDYATVCLGNIAVASRHFEYLGETAAHQAGSRYRARCARRARGVVLDDMVAGDSNVATSSAEDVSEAPRGKTTASGGWI